MIIYSMLKKREPFWLCHWFICIIKQSNNSLPTGEMANISRTNNQHSMLLGSLRTHTSSAELEIHSSQGQGYCSVAQHWNNDQFAFIFMRHRGLTIVPLIQLPPIYLVSKDGSIHILWKASAILPQLQGPASLHWSAHSDNKQFQ